MQPTVSHGPAQNGAGSPSSFANVLLLDSALHTQDWGTRGRVMSMAVTSTYMCTANCPRMSTTMYMQQIEGGGRSGARVVSGFACDI